MDIMIDFISDVIIVIINMTLGNHLDILNNDPTDQVIIFGKTVA